MTQKELKVVLHYDSKTGIFTWLERPLNMFKLGKWQLNICNSWNTKYAGKEAGHKWKPKTGSTFYNQIRITLNGKKKLYRAHRLAFLYMTGAFPGKDVDHIDHNGMNNSWSNLGMLVDKKI